MKFRNIQLIVEYKSIKILLSHKLRLFIFEVNIYKRILINLLKKHFIL